MGFRILLQNSLTVHHSDVCIKFLDCTSFGCHFLHEAQHIFVMDKNDTELCTLNDKETT